MHFKIWHSNIWFLALSVFITGIAILIAFQFVDRIYRSSNESRKRLLAYFSVFTGTGLWANHLLISLAFHNAKELTHNPAMLVIGWVFAVSIGYIVLTLASKRYFNLSSFALGSSIASLCIFMLFYCTLLTMHNAKSIQFITGSTVYALILSGFGFFIIALLKFWINDYVGKNTLLVRLLFAYLIAGLILAIHLTLNNATVFLQSVETIQSTLPQNKLIGIIISLAFLCLFLLVFVFMLFYEKHGNTLFAFRLLNTDKLATSESQTMLDNLTKLSNRKGFRHNLNTAINRSNQSGKTAALAYIDLDHFKPINDQYGHHVGDIVLSAVAQRLQAAVRGCDSVARLGGDEFAAIIEDIESDEDILPIVERIVDCISLPFYVNSQQINISCSVGIAVYPRDGDIDNLIVCADGAMYKAKANGKNQFRFYDAELEIASNKLLDMQRDLRSAIKNNQFTLLFQPKLDCKTQLFVGAEALIRWHHPSKGLIMPKEIIPVAEHLGLIDEISDWVTQEACRAIGHAKTQGIDLNLSINLSKHRFRNKNLVLETIGYLKQHGAPAKNLTVEIKETSGVRDEALFNQLIAEFKAAGIRIALDDFGLHPFTLNYLQDLSVDEIKIDRSFVSKMNTEPASWKLIDVLINLAHTLNVNVVAEGVENELQSDVLTQLGCNHMQGYLFSKPITEVDLYQFCKQFQFSIQASLLPAEENLTSV